MTMTVNFQPRIFAGSVGEEMNMSTAQAIQVPVPELAAQYPVYDENNKRVK